MAPDPKEVIFCLVHLPLLDINIYRDNGTHTVIAAMTSAAQGGITITRDKFGATEADTLVLRQSRTGGLIGKTRIGPIIMGGNPKTGFLFEPEDLHDPNDIGPPPDPSAGVLLPRNSGAIVVGLGSLQVAKAQTSKYGDKLKVVHEQYWRRSSQSYALGPGQQKTVTVQQKSGVTMSTKNVEELSLMVGASASVGYGPFSATLSAALNYSSSHSEARTLTNERTTSMEDVVKNTSGSEISIFIWELVDLFHLYSDKTYIMLESVQSPSLVRVFPPNASLACCDAMAGRQYHG